MFKTKCKTHFVFPHNTHVHFNQTVSSTSLPGRRESEKGIVVVFEAELLVMFLRGAQTLVMELFQYLETDNFVSAKPV